MTGRPDLLGIYLNDHLAAAAGGVALARRTADAHRGTDAEADTERLAREIAEDRDSLTGLMRRLGVRRTYYKEPFALVAERVGRLKSNGAVVRRSPLSSVVEYEALTLAITGKRAGWISLREVAPAAITQGELDALVARADAQLDLVEALRRAAVRTTFGSADQAGSSSSKPRR